MNHPSDAFADTHVLRMSQYDRDALEQLFGHADRLGDLDAAIRRQRLVGRVLITAFYQNSTRTRLAHESAMVRMGGNTSGFADPKATRAGDFYAETIADTAHMLSGYGDVVVVRHPQTGAADEFARNCSVPVINAGDGWGEHPTQAMADLYTIRQFRGQLDGTRVALVGDLRMRTMRSLLRGLSRYDCPVVLVAPDGRGPEDSLVDELRTQGTKLSWADDVRDVLSEVDIVCMESVVRPDYTRGHHEPADDKPATDPRYRLDRRILAEHGSADLRVLHSLPRNDELATDVDDTRFNGYWREAANGVAVRMALLDLMLGRRS